MKSIVDIINEGNVNEGNVNEGRYEVDSCRAVGKMKYGYMFYEEPSGTVTVIQFNKLSEYCDYEGFYEEDFMEIDKLEVGDSVYDGVSAIYTRIW